MPAIDVNRTTSNIELPTEVSNEIWAQTLEGSAIMQLASTMTIPGTGVKFQTITGEPTAEWVAETEQKPVGKHTFGSKTVTPYKMAVIEPFSMEFARDASALYDECVKRLPFALSRLFDATVMSTSAPGTGFDVLGNCTKVSLTPASGKTLYDQFVTVDGNISAADGIMSGIALAPQGKSMVLGAVDGMGHPLFTPGVGSNAVGNILGATVQVAKGIYTAASPKNIVGIAGDFAEARFGYVDGINMAVTDQATLTVGSGEEVESINLWQRNMFAVRFECEVAFVVKDAAKFNLLTE